ncbi:hypothetical protein AB0B15_02890 [Streptomyces sp. NPDC045456]|uniref:hypothetical protein n=1 Tax=Streptomyces sp. NPDC045456 TaxID=3155254 RepID=UPI0033EAF203
MLIEKGMIFSTIAEKGCQALSDPDEEGKFLGLDSSDVECEFPVEMVLTAKRPEYLVTARLVVDGAELSVTDQVAASFYPPLEAVAKLAPQPGEMFAIWEAGDVEPTEESAKALSQDALPQFVYVYVGCRLWMLDGMYVGVTKSTGRG